MTVDRIRRPSGGFLALCASLVLLVVFVAWGLAQPPLDRVFELHHLLKLGEVSRLAEADRRLLRRELADHRRLARDLLDGEAFGMISAHREGWLLHPAAVLVRTEDPQAPRRIVIDVATPADLLPVRLVVAGEGWRIEREARAHGTLEVPLPPLRGPSELVELEVRGRDLRDDPSVLGIRVTWEAGR